MSIVQSAHLLKLENEVLTVDVIYTELEACFLDYSLALLRVMEPMEDRMEQALFSPPLSKQRVEFALQHIKESCATTLIDFGCGSGSLLDYPTDLDKVVGVDISQKSLARAAKVLHSKLSRFSDASVPCTCLKSALLFEGSVTVFDSRVCGGFTFRPFHWFQPMSFWFNLQLPRRGTSKVEKGVLIKGRNFLMKCWKKEFRPM